MGAFIPTLLRGRAPLSWLKSLWLRNVRTSPKGSPLAPCSPASPLFHASRVPVLPWPGSLLPLACHPRSQPDSGVPCGLLLHVLCLSRADLLSPAHRAPGVSQPACDVHALPCSPRGGRPAMTGTSCVSTPPSTPRRRSSWPSRRPSPTQSVPSSWCLTRWPRTAPGARSTRVVSTGSGGHSPFPGPRGDLAGQRGPPGGRAGVSDGTWLAGRRAEAASP